MERTDDTTVWKRPVQKKAGKGGGVNWVNEAMHGSRSAYLKAMQKEMKAHVAHEKHVQHHKKQVADLIDRLTEGEIVIQSDFIQNISHGRGKETSSSYFAKRQTTLLSMVVWYKHRVGNQIVLRKEYVDYLSSYLRHNSLYFQKSMTHLMTYLRETLGINFKKVSQ